MRTSPKKLVLASTVLIALGSVCTAGAAPLLQAINPPAETWSTSSSTGATVAGRDRGVQNGPVSTPPISDTTVATPTSVGRPCSLPACDEGVSTPPVDVATPSVASITLSTDPVTVKGACTPVACLSSFTLPSLSVGPTPAVASQRVRAQSVAPPAACQLAGVACRPIELPGLASASVPAIGPLALVPGVAAKLSTTDWTLWTSPNLGGTSRLAPRQVAVPVAGIGTVNVTLFPNGIDLPALPGAGMTGTLRLTILAGDRVISTATPVAFII